jgi:hypothetical protein
MPQFSKKEKNLDLEWYDAKNKEFRDIISGYKTGSTGKGFTPDQRERILEKIRPEANLISRYKKNCLMRDFLNILYNRISAIG